MADKAQCEGPCFLVRSPNKNVAQCSSSRINFLSSHQSGHFLRGLNQNKPLKKQKQPSTKYWGEFQTSGRALLMEATCTCSGAQRSPANTQTRLCTNVEEYHCSI
uniref:Uncharacterized protein n=1 Tax=Knipowitschia caucasica TaxID=637954 RepID=A0AAV2KGK7_KNICA